MNIYVGNLAYDATDAQLQELFSQYGAVQTASVIMDRATGQSRGFGFVEMPDDAQAQAAIDALNEKDFNGRALTVNQAQPRESKPRRSGGGGGGFRENR
ncbi:MAG: RNA-binding protein [Phycisphaerae bacterium]